MIVSTSGTVLMIFGYKTHAYPHVDILVTIDRRSVILGISIPNHGHTSHGFGGLQELITLPKDIPLRHLRPNAQKTRLS